MEEENNHYFMKALSDFAYDMACGAQIRHLADLGYTVNQMFKGQKITKPLLYKKRAIVGKSKRAFQMKRIYFVSAPFGNMSLDQPCSEQNKGRYHDINIFGTREVLAYVTATEEEGGSRRLFFSTVFPTQLQFFCSREGI